MALKMTITVPPNVTVTYRNGKPPYDARFVDLVEILLEDMKWGKTLESLEHRREVRKKFEKLVEENNGSLIGSELVLTKQEHALLLNVAKAPSKPYEPVFGDQAISLIYAITEAKPNTD